MEPQLHRAYMEAVAVETNRTWLTTAREAIDARIRELAQEKMRVLKRGDRVLYVGKGYQRGLIPNMSKGTVLNVRRTRVEIAFDNSAYSSLVCPPGILELIDEQHKPLMPMQPQVRIVDINDRLTEAQSQLEQMGAPTTDETVAAAKLVSEHEGLEEFFS